MDHQGAIKHILDRLEKELPSHLTYHGHRHTLDVMEATERIGVAEGLDEASLNLVLVAAAYHDSGFLFGHQEHEKKGCEIASELLPQYGFGNEDIQQICLMIMATKVPQQPTDKLSTILCDADLDYLGRDDFEPIANSLFKELKVLGIVDTIEAWNRIQLGFLSKHAYHTSYGKDFRQSEKLANVEKIRAIVDGYEN